MQEKFAPDGPWNKTVSAYNDLQSATEALKPLAPSAQPGRIKSFLQSIADFFTSVFGGGKAGVAASQVSRQIDVLEQELKVRNLTGEFTLEEKQQAASV